MGKTLEELTRGLQIESAGDFSMEMPVAGVVYDSRKVEQGCLFVCIRGAKYDGHDAMEEVTEKGAAVIVAEDREKGEAFLAKHSGASLLYVEDCRYALGVLSAAWFGHPAEKLKTIGVTGTKGKTTTTYLIKSMLEQAGMRCGLMGTIEIDTGSRHIPSVNTTPESYLIQEYFAEMVENGCDAVVMEVSSQALMMHRVSGFTFSIGVFTNLSPDHIGANEHESFEDYKYCKSLLFRQCVTGILNGDAPYHADMLKGNLCGKVYHYGIGTYNDYRAMGMKDYRQEGILGVSYRCIYPLSILENPVRSPFPGLFSVYNSLAALAVADVLGISPRAAAEGLEKASVKGRIEMLPVSSDYTLMIDYAHNATALESLLTTLRKCLPDNGGRLVSLFGCGGNRAKSRRYEMGEVSGRLADLTIVTSDNPRDEEPAAIIEDILTGMKKTSGEYVTIPDRKEAIGYALDHAQPGDIIILAGKGHEDYQEIKGVKHHMDERELVMELLRERGMESALKRMREKYAGMGITE